MKDWNYVQIINLFRGITAVLFLCITGIVFLYSQFTETPLHIETIQLLLGVLLPYFALDTLISVHNVKNEKVEKEDNE